MNKIIIFQKLFYVLKSINKISSIYIIAGLGLLAVILEIIGIGLVPILIISILDPVLIENFSQKNNLPFLYEFIKKDNASLYLLFLFFMVFTIKSIVMIFTNKAIIDITENTRVKLISSIYLKILNQNYSFFSETNSAKNISDIQIEPAQLSLNFMKPLSIIIVEFIIIFFVTIGLIFFNYQITLILFLILLISSLMIIFASKKRLSKLGYERQINEKSIRQALQETFGSIKEIKIFGLENFFYKKFEPEINSSAKIEKVYQFLSTLPRIWFEFVMILMTTVLVSILILLNYSSTEINALIGLYAAVFFRMIPSYNRIIVSLQLMRYSLPAVESTYKNIYEFSKIENIPSKKLKFKDNLKFNNIFFKFSKNSKNYFFEDINFEINKRDKILINGITGSGKTTLLTILIGILKIEKGDIVVDGTKQSPESYLIDAGYVPQNIYLLDDTILNNILIGRKFDNEKFKKSLRLSQLEKFIDSLPESTNTFVGEKGTKLSGGQVQRIGIARALYNNPDVIVLDEATNSLDKSTENKILEEIINNNELTVIAISHNFKIKEYFKKIFLVENGKISFQE